MMSEVIAPPAAGERIFISEKNVLITAENDFLDGKGVELVETTAEIKDEFIPETEEETNISDAAPIHAHYKEENVSEFSPHPTTVENHLEPLERIFISVEDNFTATESDLLNENSSTPIAVIDGSVPETVSETIDTGYENQFFEISQHTTEIKTEEESRLEDDPLAGCVLHYVDISRPEETDLSFNRDEVDGCVFERETGFDSDTTNFEEADVCVNELDSKDYFLDQQFRSSNASQLCEVSVVLEDLFDMVPRDAGTPVQRHTNSKYCPCVFCTGKFKMQPKRRMLKKNVKSSHHSERTKNPASQKWISCSLCPARFRFMHNLARHSTTDHLVYLCTECPSKFQLRSDLQTHLKLHPGKRLYFCVFCSFKCKMEVELKIHARVHSTEKLFSCAECFVEFDKSQSLLDHVQMHLSGKFKKSCSKEAPINEQKSCLASHSKEVVSRSSNFQSEKSFLCTSSATVKTQKQLLQHTSVRSQNQPLSSQDHTVRLKKKGGVWSCSLPQQNIDSQRKHSCEICSAEFYNKGSLTRHLATHSNGRPLSNVKLDIIKAHSKVFKCEICPASFKIKAQLIRHLFVHGKEKAFACEVCGIKFKIAEQLVRHYRVKHPKEKRFFANGQSVLNYRGLSDVGAAYLDKVYSGSHCDAALEEHTVSESQKVVLECSVNQSQKEALEPSVNQPKTVALERSVDEPEKKRFQCGSCSAKFKFRSSLKQHMTTHFGGQKNSCPVCSAKFRLKVTLTRHLATHSNVDHPVLQTPLTKRRFACEICPASFGHLSILTRHLVVHSSDRPFTCGKCGAKFKTKTCLRRHVMTHTRKQRYACKKCHLFFKSKRQANEHKVRYHPSKNQSTQRSQFESSADHEALGALGLVIRPIKETFQCSYCTAKFLHMRDLRQHLIIHLPFPCPYCAARFKTRRQLKQHVVIHSNTGHSCQVCDVRFTTKLELTRHLAVHSNDRLSSSADLDAIAETHSKKGLFCCELCDAKFEVEETYKRHCVVHSADRLFFCAQCSFKCRRKSDVKAHIAWEHPSKVESAVHSGRDVVLSTESALQKRTIRQRNKKIFRCSECAADFVTKNGLNHHLIVHSNVRAFSCPVFPASFKRKDALTKHVFRHSSANLAHPQQDAASKTTCKLEERSVILHSNANLPHLKQNAAFETSRKLGEHSIVQPKERTFQCSHCPRIFKQKASLELHMTLHSRKQNYTCKWCSAVFNTRARLTRHLPVHSGDQSLASADCDSMLTRKNGVFSCQICPATFMSRGHLISHLMVHSSEKLYTCAECNAKFKRKRELTGHLIAHSNERRFSCTECPWKFKRQRELTNHLKRCHSQAQCVAY